jgi:hypothetical protein
MNDRFEEAVEMRGGTSRDVQRPAEARKNYTWTDE